MWPISFREFLTGVAVLLLGSGLMFWGAASHSEIPMSTRGSGFALMASAGAFLHLAVPLTAGGILLLAVSLIPLRRTPKRRSKDKSQL